MSIGLWQIILLIAIFIIAAIPIAIAIRIDKKEGKNIHASRLLG
ncbi:MAG: hypothetical protein WDZ54_03690 [Sneathiella sp.]